ncbi:MAG: hypothetical protein L3J39_10745 [Verrucomicrobiales bacterium]|nr:hypothetical protein [Verrucomicrobiales bacterium]
MTPISIITEGEWDRALFTTYALSLSFFETQLLKEGLSKGGCRDIQLVADVDGYEMSLSERQSHRVGNEYRLLPAALDNGVFHPKISYLSGKEDDVLLVGSGNLTFGGYGRNVECLEVFRKTVDGQIFADFADMLDLLSKREDLWLPDTTWINSWRERSLDGLITKLPDFPDLPRLLHSVERPIGEQIAELVEGLGGVKEVRVLSPFYDPDAKGILAFAEMLNCSRLVVGLLPGREERTTFPFSNCRQSDVEIQAAYIDCPEDTRSLHAKWFVIVLDSGDKVIISGSVNATRKSLMTSDNIEAAVLRIAPKNVEASLGWKKTDAPATYESLSFRGAGLGQRVFVHGVLHHDGQVSGEIAAKGKVQGEWQIILTKPDGFSSENITTVNDHGRFRMSPDYAEEFAFSSGVQITVVQADRQGSGWVHVEPLLQTSRRGYLSPSLMMRMMSSDAELDDDAELLRYLALSANKHLPAFAERIASKSSKTQSSEDETAILEDQRVATETLGTFVGGFEFDSVGSGDDTEFDRTFNQMMEQLRRRLIEGARENAKRVASPSREVDDEKQTEKEDQEQERQERGLAKAYKEFQDRMEGLTHSLGPGENRSAALCMWFEVSLLVLIDRLKRLEDVEPFVRHWLTQALRGQTIENSREALSYHVFAATATLAALEIDRSSQSPERSLSRLHEQVDRYTKGATEMSLLESLEIFDTNNAPLVTNLTSLLNSAVDLRAAVKTMLSVPTTDQQLKEIQQALDSGQPVSEDLPLWSIPAGKCYKQFVDSEIIPQLKPRVLGRTACPHCSIQPIKSVLLELEKYRFAQCSNCQKFITDPN